jgi:hypothetical protein
MISATHPSPQINASARYDWKFDSLKLGVASPKSVFSIAVLAAAVMLSHAISGCSPPLSLVAISWWFTGK